MGLFLHLDHIQLGYLQNESKENNLVVCIKMEENKELDSYIKNHLREIMEHMAQKGLLFFYISKPILSALDYIKPDKKEILNKQQLERAIRSLSPSLNDSDVDVYLKSIINHKEEIYQKLENRQELKIPSANQFDEDYYDNFFLDIADQYGINDKKESSIYTLELTENEKGTFNKLLIGSVYEINLEPAQMAVYSLVLTLGTIKVSELERYKEPLKKVLKKAQSINISDKKNEETIRKIINDKSLPSILSDIKEKIQDKLSINPQVYRQYQINRDPALGSDMLSIDLSRDYIKIPSWLIEIYKVNAL